MKRALSIITALAMMLVMVVPAFASNTTISTSVPYEHSVTVVYNDGGYVLVNGKLCPSGTQFNINRFGEIDLGAICENGYHLESIEVNGADVTEQIVSGNLKIANIVTDVFVEVVFEKCSSDPDDKCGKVDMEGTVYLGDKELKGAELSFDFGSITAKTDKDGRYYVEDISDGKHIVTISKDGEVLSNTSFVIERADVDEVTLTTASDGTQVVLIPVDADKIYLDFNIIDNDENGIPDKDPDDTDPGDPDVPTFEDPDGDPDIPNPDITPDPDDDGDGILDMDDPDHPDYDSDDDGIPDRVDTDDDNDGVDDDEDLDDDGDGIPDKDDPNHPDRDTDGDGTPDSDDNDDDNDGINDDADTDDDGDGIPDVNDPDSPDRDTDGDGIPDSEDDDDDNDGLPDGPLYDGDSDDDDNNVDKDTDGDGISDKDDDDDDNDGIPDSEDPDSDGDGHIDDYDGTPDGDDDNDGVVITIGGPKEDVPIIPIPDTFVELFENPIIIGSLMGLSLFFLILIIFKRKKDEEDEREIIVE